MLADKKHGSNLSVLSELEESEHNEPLLNSEQEGCIPTFFSLQVDREGQGNTGVSGCTLLLPVLRVGQTVPSRRGRKLMFSPRSGAIRSSYSSHVHRPPSCRRGCCEDLPRRLRGQSRRLFAWQAEVESFILLFPEGAGFSHLLESGPE